jgi:hypothetical protein
MTSPIIHLSPEGLGDICASYSADTIAFKGEIRKPFRWQGRSLVVTAIHGDQAEAYAIVPLDRFKGSTTTYDEKTSHPDRAEAERRAEAARNDPNGFYHGITIKSGKSRLVLSGPKMTFAPAPNQKSQSDAQLSLTL